jgi:glycosyltransferase involved in cell wall biosynthesis
LRILFTESSPNFGGQELRIVQDMQWLQARGHKVWLAAAVGSGIEKTAARLGLNIVPIQFRGSINPRALLRLAAACRRLQVRLIVASNSRDVFTAWLASRMLNIPLVRFQHVCKPLKSDVFHKLSWRLFPQRIVAGSESIRQRLIEQGLAAPERIEVIGSYVDRAVFHPGVAPGSVRARHGIPEAAPLIMQIGMIRPDKGQAVLVRAVDEILEKQADCWFMFVGSACQPAADHDLRQVVQSIRHPERIVFAGFQRDVAPYIAASDIICLTSLIEAQSKVIPEAFAMRKLVVASNTGGIAELVRHGENGFLYQTGSPHALANAVAEAFHADREKIVSNAFQFAQRLDISRVLQREEDLYRQLAA